jgi:hypothetical protein
MSKKAMRAKSLAEQIDELNDPVPKGLSISLRHSNRKTNASVQTLIRKI